MKKIYLLSLVLLTVMACKEKEVQTQETTQPVDVKQNLNEVKFCTKEAKICPDGSSVARNLKNNCEFDPCPTKVTKNPAKKEPMICTADVKECADGSFVGRDHYNNCAFKECPKGEKSKEKI